MLPSAPAAVHQAHRHADGVRDPCDRRWHVDVVRYFGGLSSHSKLRRPIVPVIGENAPVPVEAAPKPKVGKRGRRSKYIPRRELLKRTFGVDIPREHRVPGLPGGLRLIAFVRTATGERIFTKWYFREILEKHAAPGLQPGLCHAGGISEGRVIAGMAEAFYTSLAPHNPLGAISLAAGLQLDAAIPNFLCQEQVSLGEGYIKTPFKVKDGSICRRVRVWASSLTRRPWPRSLAITGGIAKSTTTARSSIGSPLVKALFSGE